MSSIIAAKIIYQRKLLMTHSLYMLCAMKAGGHASAPERVRQHIKDWLAHNGHGAGRKLAEFVGEYGGETPRSDQWVTDIKSGKNALTLHDLDAVAELLQVPPGELVRLPDRAYLELTFTEFEIVSAFRTLPFSTQQHIASAIRQMLTARGRISERQQKGIADVYVDGVKLTGGGVPIDGEGASSAASGSPSRETTRAHISRLIDALAHFAHTLDTPDVTDAPSGARTGTPQRPPDRRRTTAPFAGRRPQHRR